MFTLPLKRKNHLFVHVSHSSNGHLGWYTSIAKSTLKKHCGSTADERMIVYSGMSFLLSGSYPIMRSAFCSPIYTCFVLCSLVFFFTCMFFSRRWSFVRHMSMNAGWDVMWWRLLYYPSWRKKEGCRVLPPDTIEWCRVSSLSLFLDCHVSKKKDMEKMAHHFTNGDKKDRP